MGASIPIIQDQAELEAVWQQVLDRLRGALNGATYSLTFERARALGFDDGGVVADADRHPRGRRGQARADARDEIAFAEIGDRRHLA